MARSQSDTVPPRASATGRPRGGFDPAEAGTSESLWTPFVDALPTPDWDRRADGMVVVVAPHPDDETLGAGGTLYDLMSRGWRAVVVAVTDGEEAYGHDAARVARLRRVRPLEQARALFRLSPDVQVRRLGIPDGRVADHAATLEAALLPLVRTASLLLTTWRSDGHPDHEATAAVTARVGAAAGVPVAEFPIWGWHWGTPDDLPRARLRGWRLSSSAASAKRRALRAYPSQTAPAEGPPVLPPHVVARFLRPVEAFLV